METERASSKQHARTENVPSHMRPGWYSCTYRTPLLLVENALAPSVNIRNLEGTASDASPGEKRGMLAATGTVWYGHMGWASLSESP